MALGIKVSDLWFYFDANKQAIRFCNSRSDYDDDGGQRDEPTQRF